MNLKELFENLKSHCILLDEQGVDYEDVEIKTYSRNGDGYVVNVALMKSRASGDHHLELEVIE